MVAVKRGSVKKETSAPKHTFEVITLDERGREDEKRGDFVKADCFEVECDGTLALFYVMSEDLERELVCAIKNWHEIRKMDPDEVVRLIQKAKEFRAAAFKKANSIYEPPGKI